MLHRTLPSIGRGQLCAVIAAIATLAFVAPVIAQITLVQDGVARAQIVIDADAPRTVKLAAEELRDHVQKMSGATLPIVIAESSDVPARVYVGRSAATIKRGLVADDLRHGAFKIVCEPDRLFLLGNDTPFKPPVIWNRDGSPASQEKLFKEWDARTGEKFGYPYVNLFKQYNDALGIWDVDERGSLNAVYELLRNQGVRWYLPDEMGIVIPDRKTIQVPATDRTVKPDFAVRYPYQYGREFTHEAATRDEVLWRLRLGENRAPDVIGHLIGHGINDVHSRDEVKAAHPEYYLLLNGKRDTTTIEDGRPCLSSQGLFEQNVKYARSVFDVLGAPMISVMPQDGFGTLCQCDLCKGKDTPGRGWDGVLSDYVWGYVDRVARELYKTHPDRKVLCFAYAGYLLPPEKIKQLSPNVVVGICQHRYTFIDPAKKKKFDGLRDAWTAKLAPGSQQLLIYDYYLHTNPRNFPHMPFVFPQAIARDLKSLRGRVIGDYVEVFREKKGMQTLAVDHLNMYVTSRLWWDATQDVNALLEDYYTHYYGLAREPMKAFVELCEANLLGIDKNAPAMTKALALLEQARGLVPADSAHAKRIKLVADYVAPMSSLIEQLAKGRGEVPEALGFEREIGELKLDGKLDEEFWQNLRQYKLSDLQTGRTPHQGTTFKIAWAGESLVVGVRCEDSDTKQLNIATRKNEDPAIWNGDCVELLLETQSHAYYQITFNPAGALADLDRKRELNMTWNSGAQVSTFIGDGFWTAEIRIPALGTQQTSIDALQGVAGNKPVEAYPWYFNVCRQRIRVTETETSAFSPTGQATFHDEKKFGKLMVR